MKSKPNGLSGDDEHPSELQSRDAGLRALRAAKNVEMGTLKRRRSVACTAVS